MAVIPRLSGFLCFLAFCSVASAQVNQNPTPGLDANHLAYFDHLFLRYANIDDRAADLQRRQGVLVKLLQLNVQEEAALHVAVQAFQVGLAPLRQQVNSTLAAKLPLTGSGRAALDAVVQQRKSLVSSVGLKFLNSLSPEAKARLSNAARFVVP